MGSDGTPGALSGPHVEYTKNYGYRIAVYNNRVQITQATSGLGTAQEALVTPVTVDQAREIADALLRGTT
jgi:hypothetical protein